MGAIGTDKAHGVGATIKTMITQLDTALQAPTWEKNPAIWTIMAIGKDKAHRLGAPINAMITHLDTVNTTGKMIGDIKITEKPLWRSNVTQIVNYLEFDYEAI